MNTKQFHIGDLLSVHPGNLVSPRHMDGVYDILNFMTGDDLFTHQLPRAHDECEPYLLDQHPWLKDAGLMLSEQLKAHPYDEGLTNEQNVALWLAPIIAKYGEFHQVRPMPMDDHDVIDPIEELRRMNPDAEIITFDANIDEPSLYGDLPPKADR